MRTKLLAVATAAMLAFSFAAHAEEAPVDPEGDQVSDAVDIAMFCGAAFTVASMSDQVTADQKAASEQMATLAFARAKTALDADGVEATEYDRLTKFYVDAAISDMSAGTQDMRYSADDCVAEAQK